MTIHNEVPFLSEELWPYEEGTLIVPIILYDDAGNIATPNNDVTYTLVNFSGAVINNLQDVSVPPSSDMNVILTGDDLVVGSEGTDRELQIDGTYDSQIQNGLSISQAVRFYIRPRA